MSAKLTNNQISELLDLRDITYLYQAARLRRLINDYIVENQRHSSHSRKEHAEMVDYFKVLLHCTASNVLPK